MTALRLIAAAGLLLLTGRAAHAQNCPFGAGFDLCMMRFNQGNMNQLRQEQQRNFQEYVRTNQDWLRPNYQAHLQSGGRMTPQQFAEWGLTTANGTNYQGAADMQRRSFEGNQRAHNTIMEGNRDYIIGMENRSRRTSEIAQQYSQGAVRGNAPFIDPNTGQTHYLPYAAQPNQPFSSGGQVYVQTPNGAYYQQRGNSWVQMNPGR